MCFTRRKAIAAITANVMGPNVMGPNAVGPNVMGPNVMGPNVMGPTTLLDTFAQFHQLIIWEIASHLPLAELQNLLKVAKKHKHLKDALMLVINSQINPIIDQMNVNDTQYCLTRCRISRPLAKKDEIDFIRTNLCNYFNSYDKRVYTTENIMAMLDYIENEPTKEEQMRASHVILAYYYIAVDSKGNAILPEFYRGYNK